MAAPSDVEKLVYVTNLKPHYAQQLLNAGGSYENAMQLYIDAKRDRTLPADALQIN